MTFNEYQEQALTTLLSKNKIVPNDVSANTFVRMVLGLVGESGEFADKIKKIYRDDEAKLSDESHELLVKELGDVLWYIAVLAEHLGVELDAVAQKNLSKLADRKERGTTGGSGDNR